MVDRGSVVFDNPDGLSDESRLKPDNGTSGCAVDNDVCSIRALCRPPSYSIFGNFFLHVSLPVVVLFYLEHVEGQCYMEDKQ